MFGTRLFYLKLLYSKFVGLKKLWDPNFFLTLVFLRKTFWDLIFFTQIFLDPTLLGPKVFWTWIVFGSKILRPILDKTT